MMIIWHEFLCDFLLIANSSNEENVWLESKLCWILQALPVFVTLLKKALFKVTFRIRDVTINLQKHCITRVDVQYIIVLFGTRVGRNKSDITCKFV